MKPDLSLLTFIHIALKRSSLFMLLLGLISCDNGVNKKITQLQNGQLQPNGITITYPLNGTIFPPRNYRA